MSWPNWLRRQFSLQLSYTYPYPKVLSSIPQPSKAELFSFGKKGRLSALGYEIATRCPQEDFSPGNITGGPLGVKFPTTIRPWLRRPIPLKRKGGLLLGGWQLLQEIGYKRGFPMWFTLCAMAEQHKASQY